MGDSIKPSENATATPSLDLGAKEATKALDDAKSGNTVSDDKSKPALFEDAKSRTAVVDDKSKSAVSDDKAKSADGDASSGNAGGLTRAQRRAAASNTATSGAAATQVEPPEPVVEKVQSVGDMEPSKANVGQQKLDAPAVYKVAVGKSLTSVRGMLHAGEVVTVKDFGGDAERLEELRVAGVLEKRDAETEKRA